MFLFIENSKLYKKHLIKKYKPQIIPKVNTQAEIIGLLKKELDLIKGCAENIDPIFWKIGVLSNLEEYNTDSFNFEIYKIKHNNKSKKLYEYSIKEYGLSDDEDIYIVFEQNTKFMTSNCNILLTKLILFKGISQFDYDNETPLFMSYINTLKHYLEEQILF